MKTTLLTSGLVLLMTGAGFARTWTSADGGKTFDGDFISSQDDSVTVSKNGRTLTFKLDILSLDDRNWVKDAVQKAAEADANKEAAAEFAESDFGKSFQKLRKLDGKSFGKHSLESVPEYFILYFSASW